MFPQKCFVYSSLQLSPRPRTRTHAWASSTCGRCKAIVMPCSGSSLLSTRTPVSMTMINGKTEIQDCFPQNHFVLSSLPLSPRPHTYAWASSTCAECKAIDIPCSGSSLLVTRTAASMTMIDGKTELQWCFQRKALFFSSLLLSPRHHTHAWARSTYKKR